MGPTTFDMIRTILIVAILCGAVFGMGAEEQSDMKSQTHAPMHPHHGHGHHGHHGFGKVLHKIAKVFGVHRRSHHGEGKHDAMKEEMRANLKTNCGQDVTDNSCDTETQCPRKQLKCLAAVAEGLSPVCAEFVTTTMATMQERHHGHHSGGHHSGGHNDESSDEEAAPSDAMKEEMRANLKTNCGQDVTDNSCDTETQCPRKQLKCLAAVAEGLSP